MERFREGCSSSKSEDDELEWNSGRQFPPVLVCTDLAARGLDLTVDHVVMFDFPNNPVSFLSSKLVDNIKTLSWCCSD